jgi:hypothetical protein
MADPATDDVTGADERSATTRSIEAQREDLVGRRDLLRSRNNRHFADEDLRINTAHAEQSRRHAGLAAQAKAADDQVASNRKFTADLQAQAERTRAEITTMQREGRLDEALEAQEGLGVVEAKLSSLAQQTAQAEEAAKALHAEADAAKGQLDTIDDEWAAMSAKARAAEAAADVLDEKIMLLGEAQVASEEVDRLTAEAHRLEAEGRHDEGAEVRAAADQHATAGVDALRRAEALVVDQTAIDAIPGANPDDIVIDPDLIEIDGESPTTAPGDGSGGGVDPDLIDMDPDTPEIDAEPPAATPAAGDGDAPAPSKNHPLWDKGEDIDRQAATARAALDAHYRAESQRLAVARDEAARTAWSADQEAKAADQQVTRERRVHAEAEQRLQELERVAADPEADFEAAREAREALARARADVETAELRVDGATRAADQARTEAAAARAQVDELEGHQRDLGGLTARAERAIDRLEDQAALYREAGLYRESAALSAERVKEFEAAGDTEGAEKARQEGLESLRLAEQREQEAVEAAGSQTVLDDIPGATPGAPPVAPSADAAATGDGDVVVGAATADVLGDDEADGSGATVGDVVDAEQAGDTEDVGDSGAAGTDDVDVLGVASEEPGIDAGTETGEPLGDGLGGSVATGDTDVGAVRGDGSVDADVHQPAALDDEVRSGAADDGQDGGADGWPSAENELVAGSSLYGTDDGFDGTGDGLSDVADGTDDVASTDFEDAPG